MRSCRRTASSRRVAAVERSDTTGPHDVGGAHFIWGMLPQPPIPDSCPYDPLTENDTAHWRVSNLLRMRR
jgi:hypothetical protein